MSTSRSHQALLFAKRALNVCCLFLALNACRFARADDYTWKSSSGGLWATPTAWTPTGVPTMFDNATVPSLTPGFGHLTLNVEVQVIHLSLGKLNVEGDGDIMVTILSAGDTGFTPRDSSEIPGHARQVTFTNGLFGGNVFTTRKFINVGASTNFGRISAGSTTTNQLTVEELPRWSNETNSDLWLIPPADGISFQDLSIDPSAPPFLSEQFGRLDNQKGAVVGLDYPTTPARIRWTINNSGTIHVKRGTLSLENVGDFKGDVLVDAGAQLTLWTGSVTESIFRTNATFSGIGTILFKQNTPKSFTFEGPHNIPNPVKIDQAAFDGDGINFFGLVDWNNLTGVGYGPIVFLGPTTGTGKLGRHVLNFGVATDKDIHPLSGVVWENMPVSQFIATADANSPTTSRGWFTNNFLALVDFRLAFNREWNVVNDGLLLAPMTGKQMQLKGSLLQGETGELKLSGGIFQITNQFVSSGMISGYGAVTAAVAHVSGKVSPQGSNGYYGKISFKADTNPNLTFDSSTIFQMDLGSGTNDQIYAENGKFRGRFDITARDGFGPGDYLLAKYGAVVAGPFQLGIVPPGYRYQLVYNPSFNGELHLLVTQPPSQVITLRSGESGGSFSLNVSTLTNVPYLVEFADELGGDWQVWTNFVGSGQLQSIGPLPTGANGFFKVTEGTGTF